VMTVSVLQMFMFEASCWKGWDWGFGGAATRKLVAAIVHTDDGSNGWFLVGINGFFKAWIFDC